MVYFAGAGLIAVLAWVVYLPSLGGGFILDDDLLLTENNLIRAPDGLSRIWFSTEPTDYWPVANTSLWLEWRLWSASPNGYRVTNLLLHIVNCWLLWWVLAKLSIPGAFLAALLFAVHPVNVESVAWIAQRKNLLAMMFFLLSIGWYLNADPDPKTPIKPNGETRNWRWYWLSLAGFLLAMLSKGSVAILPVALMLIAWWRRNRITRRDLLRTAPFFLVAIVLTAINIWFQSHDFSRPVREANLIERLLGAGAAVWFYLSKAILPVNLQFIYPQWTIQSGNWLWWLPFLGIIVVTAVLWRGRARAWPRNILFAWLFYLLALLPALGFTDVSFMQYSLVADHYQHLALIAVVALAAAGISKIETRIQSVRGINWLRIGAGGIAVIVFSLIAARQAELYAGPIPLYTATLEKNPDCWMLQNNLGSALVSAGEPELAIPQFKQALVIHPNYPEAHDNWGRALADLKQPEAAIEHFRQALEMDPHDIAALNNWAVALVKLGQPDEAMKRYRQALEINPHLAEVQSNLGTLLAAAGQYPEAIDCFQSALRDRPELSDVHRKLAAVLLKTGQPGKAVDECHVALRLQPADVEVFAVLAQAEAQRGRIDEAILAAETAINLARLQGRTALAQELEASLQAFRTKLTNPPTDERARVPRP